jgi:hypothetical protein
MSDQFLVVEYGVRLGTDAERLAQMETYKRCAPHCKFPEHPTPEDMERLRHLFEETAASQTAAGHHDNP